ncbi:MAG: purine-nucleoside phosphorylase [Deltaproteobacteria bacterium]|nr:purine-nucleoside phosphorylase [Deltaproteobacteria bacterium]
MRPSLSIYDRIQLTRDFIRSQTSHIPDCSIIFGSGLAGDFVSSLTQRISFDFESLPYFKSSTVKGHGGVLHLGYLGERCVLVAEGRLHYYEGYPMSEVVYPIRVYHSLGIDRVLMTNAAGGLHPDFQVGDLMIVKDHLNFTGRNPLRGPNDSRLGPRFVDMSQAYDPEAIRQFVAIARRKKITLRKGIYIGILGPSYETPAEIALFRKWGADAIGMSTVPEVIAAAHLGLKTSVISCITNVLTAKKSHPLSHDQVVEAATQHQEKLNLLIREYLCKKSD